MNAYNHQHSKSVSHSLTLNHSLESVTQSPLTPQSDHLSVPGVVSDGHSLPLSQSQPAGIAGAWTTSLHIPEHVLTQPAVSAGKFACQTPMQGFDCPSLMGRKEPVTQIALGLLACDINSSTVKYHARPSYFSYLGRKKRSDQEGLNALATEFFRSLGPLALT